ncbi:MAG: MFS transporter [Victivallales bacterium]|nr:MFS transporter [Victivallales bacterium]
MTARLDKNSALLQLAGVRFFGIVNATAFVTLALLPTINGNNNYFALTSHLARISMAFVLPFLLLPGISAYLADRYSKRNTLVFTTAAEMGIMLAGVITLVGTPQGQSPALIYLLFLLGTKNCLFRTAFLGILPELFHKKKLGKVNGILTALVFFAIAVGMSGGYLLQHLIDSYEHIRINTCGWLFFLLALLSGILAFHLPATPPGNPRLPWRWSRLQDTIGAFTAPARFRGAGFAVVADLMFFIYVTYLFMAVLLHSHMVGAHGDAAAGPLPTLCGMMVGIACGCLVGGYVSRHKMESGLMLPGAAGMTIMPLFFSWTGTMPYLYHGLVYYPWLMLTIALAGFAAGSFTVPVLQYKQENAPEKQRGDFFAMGNTINYTAVVVTIMLMLVLGVFVKLPPAWLHGIFAVAVFAVTVLVVIAHPDILFRFFILLLTKTIYRLKISQAEKIPESGPALLIANHVSFVDAFFISACTSRRIHFMAHEDFYRLPLLCPLLRWAGFIEVPATQKPKQMQCLFRHTRKLLANGELICVYPEGAITENGIMQGFKKGLTRMLPESVEVPIIPIRLGMVWGSLLSTFHGKLKFMPPHELPIPVSATVGDPISPQLSAFEIRQALSELAAEAEMPPREHERTLHYHFTRRAKRHPFRKTIYDFEGNAVSNFSLLVRSLLLSREIRKIFPDDNQYVGVMLPNCTANVVSMLGIMMADKVPAILNFTAGRAAMDAAIRKANLKYILTSRNFINKANLPAQDNMVFLEDIALGISRENKFWTSLTALLLPSRELMNMYSPVSYDNLYQTAVVLFSSGSTGDPKGVMLTHHNFNSDFFSFWRVIGWRKTDRLIGNLPLFHSFGLMVCFWFPIMSGMEVVYIPNPLDASAVCRLIANYKITLMMATPTFLQAYMRRATGDQLKTLRLVITGGEKLRQDIADKFKTMTGLALVEGYGCTELSPIVSVNLSNSMFTLGTQAGKYGSIGVPLPGICVRIIDPDTGKILPENTPGLMVVRAASVMEGYLDDPAATAKVIRNGWYNTGDIAKMDWDGYLTITGRQSRFSKICGEMVPHELVEMGINEILETEERCIAICGKNDPKKGEKLVVFYSLRDLNPKEIIRKLREKELPNLWIPKAEDFVFLDQIPLLGSGKIDLQQLKEKAAAL